MQDHLKGEENASLVTCSSSTVLHLSIVTCSPCLLPSEAGYGDAVYRLCGYMSLDSSSQSQADAFKLVFDQQSDSRVRDARRPQ